MDEADITNFQTFRDCLSTPLISKSLVDTSSPRKSTKRGSKRGKKATVEAVDNGTEGNINAAEELAEFIDYIATEMFTSLPTELRSLTYSTWRHTTRLHTVYSAPLQDSTLTSILNSLDPSITDTLTTYTILSPTTSLSNFLTPILTTYLTSITTPPPPPSATRSLASGCEICEREWIPLTYHHLIPRSTWDKVLKRGWHPEESLHNVAWLCRACHSFVHGLEINEELARNWYTIERLLGREDVQRWRKWVGGVRWKKK